MFVIDFPTGVRLQSAGVDVLGTVTSNAVVEKIAARVRRATYAAVATDKRGLLIQRA